MFDKDDEYIRSLKKRDRYHFTIPFEYIKKNYGNDKYDIGKTNMEVDVIWDDRQNGYVIEYHAPEMSRIDRSQGNGTEDDFYKYDVAPVVQSKLMSMGIPAEAMVWGYGL